MSNNKKIGVLVEFNFEDLEVWYPLLRFREEGYTTVAIGPEKGKVYKSKHGYPCASDVAIQDIKAEELDALVIPGGWASDYLRRDKRFLELVKNMLDANKPVGSICHGQWVLCSAKVLKGRHVTCFHSIRDDVENAGGLYEDKAVVVDGSLVTSRVPSDLPEFCKALLQLLRS